MGGNEGRGGWMEEGRDMQGSADKERKERREGSINRKRDGKGGQ